MELVKLHRNVLELLRLDMAVYNCSKRTMLHATNAAAKLHLGGLSGPPRPNILMQGGGVEVCFTLGALVLHVAMQGISPWVGVVG